MFTFKSALAASALIALSIASCDQASARPAWYGPGSGPISPYSNFKGFAQVPRQPSMIAPRGVINGRNTSNRSQPSNGAYHCVPNVGLVGANGVCPD